ncbi:MAG TPA: GTPase, partial [Planctomicrobium sp.]|nr:GTPase [Planctomicrobium sp.]
MFSRRNITLAILIVLPLLTYLGLGAYALWQTGWFAWTFWILPVFWLITWLVATLWPASNSTTIKEELPEPGHFTPRDTQAMEIVRRYQEQINALTPKDLTNPEFYLTQTLQLSREIATHYHPKANDPIDSLTVPEVLAAARLAIDDMERWMLESVPGSRMVTIRQWKWLQHAPRWIKRAQDITWLASIFVNPANVLKYVTSSMTLRPVTEELQTEFLVAVYLRYIRQVGFYLVEMNSGRLNGGADVYRQNFGSPEQQNSASAQTTQSRLKPESVTVAIIGQVKAGKSSLVNTLIGEQVAKSDVLPETRQVTRYRLEVPNTDVFLTLLDTPGYADAGATAEQIREVKQAARDADILLLVMAANTPARAVDRAVMDELQKWRNSHPELRPAPIVICLTHIDLLSPMMEWKPP